MKSFLKSGALVLLSFAFSLILCEILIRLLAPQRLDNNLALYEPDNTVVFRMQKNFQGIYSSYEFSVPVRLNSMGFRDGEIAPRQDGEDRIVGLGDSFTFGNGVTMEETFLKQLEMCLNAGPGQRFQVINCGVPAYSPLQEFRLLEQYTPVLHPDIVVVGFFVGNDFVESGDLYDSTGAPTLRVEDGALYSNKKSDEEHGLVRRITRPVRQFLSTRSHLYIFLRNRSSELLARLGLQAYNLPPDFCEKQFSPRMERNWALTQTILADLDVFTKRNGQRLIVLILPTSYQVYEKTWNQYILGLKLNPTLYDLDKPQRILRDFFTAHHIEFVDALQPLRQSTIPHLFFPIDGHLTAAGHNVVGKLLCDYMKTHPDSRAR